MVSDSAKLVDGMGRTIVNLRISVTDRCNFRCTYCMPADNVEFMDRSNLLTFEEIQRVVTVVAKLGIHRIRLTGGEPLMRKDLPRLIKMLNEVDGIDDIAMTTNAYFLKDQAQSLRDAGLKRLNVSLDSLDPEKFHEVNRRDCLQAVLDGLNAARNAGFKSIKINAVAVRNFSETEIMSLIEMGRSDGFEVRFIEFMPLDATGEWTADRVVSRAEILEQASAAFNFAPIERGSSPAERFQFADCEPGSPGSEFGVIASVTEPFCGACDRMRLSAEGQLRNCLFGLEHVDLREILRTGGSDEQILAAVAGEIDRKWAGHAIGQVHFIRPSKSMSQLGG